MSGDTLSPGRRRGVEVLREHGRGIRCKSWSDEPNAVQWTVADWLVENAYATWVGGTYHRDELELTAKGVAVTS